MLDVCSRFYSFVESITSRSAKVCGHATRVQVCALVAVSVLASACSPTLIGNVKLSKGISNSTTSSTVSAVALTLTGPASVTAGVCSTAFTVTTVDATPVPVVVSSNTTITMAGLGAGSLYSDAGCTAGLSPVVIASGASSKTFYFKSTVAAAHTIGVSSGTLVTASSALTVNAAGAVVANSTIAGVPSTGIAADGVSTSTITVTLRDTYNNVVPGATVTFASTGTGNTIVQPAAVTDASGVATGTLASSVAEAKTISISAPAGLGAVTNTVTFIASTVSVANSTISSTTPVVADGVATSTVTITLLDASSNPVVGVTPTLTVGGTGNTVNACSATNGSGVSTCTITSTKAETKTVAIATPISKAGNNVVFTHGTATKLVYTTQPTTAVAGVVFGTQPVIEIRDANDNVVTTGADATRSVTISLQTGTGALDGSRVRSAVAGVVTYIAGDNLLFTLQGTKVIRASATLNGVARTVDSSNIVVDPIACDTGTLSTTCTISTAHTIPTGVDVAGSGNLVVASGGTLQNTNNAQDFTITMTGNVTVQSGGVINANVWPLTAANVDVQSGGVIKADYLGNLGGRSGSNATDNGLGAGGGQNGGACGTAGGGYGAPGNVGSACVGGIAGPSYGSVTAPVDYGSGGSTAVTTEAGGNGGGRLRFMVSGTMTVAGTVSALGGDGPTQNTAGGSGGTLRFEVGSIAGTGTMSVRGGNGWWGYRGWGGGGRILLQSSNAFSGTVVVTSTGDNEYTNLHGTLLAHPDGTFHVIMPSLDGLCDSGTWATTCGITSKKNLGRNQTALSGANLSLGASGNIVIPEAYNWLTLDLTGNLSMDGWIHANIKRLTAADIIIAWGAGIEGNVGSTNAATHPGIQAANLTMNDGSTISADLTGYWPTGAAGGVTWESVNNGTAAASGPSWSGSGGGHGGAGGVAMDSVAAGGTAFGSATNPREYGAAGGDQSFWEHGGFGGGIVAISLTGNFFANAQAVISAEGQGVGSIHTWGSGGGAGGSINIQAAGVSGTGTLRARGGAGAAPWSAPQQYGGGGGGGRILVARTSGAAFGGSLLVTGGASGGGTAGAGAAGTAIQSPGAADATQSTITGTGSVVADDTATSTITITLKDVNGFGVFGITPTFTATDTGATNTKGACSVSDASGVSTCTLKSRKAEIKTLAIATPVVSTGGTVTFIAGAATQLAFSTQPPETKINVDMTGGPVVAVQDQYGNTVTTGADATRTITIAKQTGAGAMTGTLTKVAVAGLADFGSNSLNFDTLGAKTLRASGTITAGARTVDSASFDIVPIKCDSGSLASGTCTITSTQTVSNGVTVTAVNLTVAGGGLLRNITPKETYTLALSGDLIVNNGGIIQGNATITAANIDIQSGGSVTADALGYLGANKPGNASDNGEGAGGGTGVLVGGGWSMGGSNQGGGAGHGGAGGHGSAAGTNGGATYGADNNPVTFGSGGGSSDTYWTGGNGGGALKMTASGTLTVNGSITANGDGYSNTSHVNRSGGGGAGGSIHLTAATVAGSGTLRADGGWGSKSSYTTYSDPFVSSGAGGGGRIYLRSANAFGGTVRVDAGGNYGTGQATAAGVGSYYLDLIGGNDALCDSGSWATTCTINSRKILGTNWNSLSVAGGLTIGAAGQLRVPTHRILLAWTLGGDLTINNVLEASFATITAANVHVGTGARWRGNIGSPTDAGLTATSIDFAYTGGIDASGLGEPSGYSRDEGLKPGVLPTGDGSGGGVCTTTGAAFSCAGGSHAGVGGSGSVGGATGAAAYGNATNPVTYGSGGGNMDSIYSVGGFGGGVVRMNISGTYSDDDTYSFVTVHGTSTSGWTGAGGLGGGGAGGSINLTIGTMAATKGHTLVASGGHTVARTSTNVSGGGGAGYIYVSAPKIWSGNAEVKGGPAYGLGTRVGGKGSYRINVPGGTLANLCDSGSLATTCVVTMKKTLPTDFTTITASGSVDIQRGGQWMAVDSLAYMNLNIAGNLTVESGSYAGIHMSIGTGVVGGTVNVRGSSITPWYGNIGSTDAVTYPGLSVGALTIDSGGTISAYATGYSGSTTGMTVAGDIISGGSGGSMYGRWVEFGNTFSGGGPGGGSPDSYSGAVNSCGGGGYGGAGGVGTQTSAFAGAAYGSFVAPLEFGSGGAGFPTSRWYSGGAGGGLLRIASAGAVTINGLMTADGEAGYQATGGGSGGSILVASQSTISGSGSVTAVGGSGSSQGSNSVGGGGGGGGRISLMRGSGAAFAGTINVSGGAAGGFAAGAGSSGTSYQELLPSGAVASWRFEEASGTSLIDATGNGHDGTLTGTVGYGATGHLLPTADRALTFDASSTYATVPDHAGIMDTQFSIETWIYLDATVGAFARVLEKGGWGIGGGYDIELNAAATGKIRFDLFNAAGNAFTAVKTDAAVTSSVWHHVVATYDGTTMKIYLDGVQQAETATATLVTNTSPLVIGKAANSSTNYFPGKMSEVTYYNRALSGAEITARKTQAGY